MFIETEVSQELEVSQQSQQQSNNAFEINKSIIDMFLNYKTGGVNAEMTFHTLWNDTVWYLCKYLISIHFNCIEISKRDDDTEFGVVKFQSKNGNVVVFYIYERFLNQLKALIKQ